MNENGPVEINPDNAERLEIPKEVDVFDRHSEFMQGRNNGVMRSEAQIISDRRDIAKYMKRGYDPFSIWELINENYPSNPLSYETIQNDIRQLKKMWMSDTDSEVVEHRAELIYYWRNLMRMYMEGYDRSLGNKDLNNPNNKLGYKNIEEQANQYFMAEVEREKLSGKKPRENTKTVKIKKIEIIGEKKWLDGVGLCLQEIGRLTNAYPKEQRGNNIVIDNDEDAKELPAATQAANTLFSLINMARANEARANNTPIEKPMKRLLSDGTFIQEKDYVEAEFEMVEEKKQEDIAEKIKKAAEDFLNVTKPDSLNDDDR